MKLNELSYSKISDGTYIFAVSGGVDSVVLLDLLKKQHNITLVIAHVDHGIRKDSGVDAMFVEELANNSGYTYETTQLFLGNDTNEDLARQKRYEFLYRMQKKHQAAAIITAHHQDDMIETMFLNIMRGTKRKGIASLQSTDTIIRPILYVPKRDIYNYAKAHNLQWREDSTNIDTAYARNNIRHTVVAKMDTQQRAHALAIIQNTQLLNTKIDKELRLLITRGLHKDTLVLNRSWFCKLPHDISTEVVHMLLRRANAANIDTPTIEKVTVAIKTMLPGKVIQVSGVDIQLTKRSARFISRSQTDEKTV